MAGSSFEASFSSPGSSSLPLQTIRERLEETGPLGLWRQLRDQAQGVLSDQPDRFGLSDRRVPDALAKEFDALRRVNERERLYGRKISEHLDVLSKRLWERHMENKLTAAEDSPRQRAQLIDEYAQPHRVVYHAREQTTDADEHCAPVAGCQPTEAWTGQSETPELKAFKALLHDRGTRQQRARGRELVQSLELVTQCEPGQPGLYILHPSSDP